MICKITLTSKSCNNNNILQCYIMNIIYRVYFSCHKLYFITFKFRLFYDTKVLTVINGAINIKFILVTIIVPSIHHR